MKNGGIELKLGTFKGGLWYDCLPDKSFYSQEGWGIKLALRWGMILWEIPKLWKGYGIWKSRWVPEAKWISVKLPGVGPFLSISLGQLGAYIGLKDNGWETNDVLLPSISIRRSRHI